MLNCCLKRCKRRICQQSKIVLKISLKSIFVNNVFTSRSGTEEENNKRKDLLCEILNLKEESVATYIKDDHASTQKNEIIAANVERNEAIEAKCKYTPIMKGYIISFRT